MSQSPVIEQAVKALTLLKESAGRALMSEADHDRDRLNYENLKSFLEGISVSEEDVNNTNGGSQS